ncbi:MAG: acetyl-CoA carboxylase biotin carboxyl carrier protein subunit, partial [Bacteroidales bacterium]|nr:acetyl-CoA carboxylase biotin carboxyl carrier protein subunit [Bacteroidales bacterium]
MKEYKFKINGKSYDVAINSVEGGIAEVRVNGKDYSVEIEGSSSAAVPAAVTKKA